MSVGWCRRTFRYLGRSGSSYRYLGHRLGYVVNREVSYPLSRVAPPVGALSPSDSRLSVTGWRWSLRPERSSSRIRVGWGFSNSWFGGSERRWSLGEDVVVILTTSGHVGVFPGFLVTCSRVVTVIETGEVIISSVYECMGVYPCSWSDQPRTTPSIGVSQITNPTVYWLGLRVLVGLITGDGDHRYKKVVVSEVHEFVGVFRFLTGEVPVVDGHWTG